MKTSNKPERTCCGCRKVFEKSLLLRVVRTPSGNVVFDPKGKENGRGAYVCRNTECLLKAKKTRRFGSVLKAQISEGVYEEIEKEIEKNAC